MKKEKKEGVGRECERHTHFYREQLLMLLATMCVNKSLFVSEESCDGLVMHWLNMF